MDFFFGGGGAGADIARRQRGVDTQGGGVNGGWGVEWTVELKMNRKKGKNWLPTAGLQPPNPPLGPPLGSTRVVMSRVEAPTQWHTPTHP